MGRKRKYSLNHEKGPLSGVKQTFRRDESDTVGQIKCHQIHIIHRENLTDELLLKLQDKLNHYLAYALDGQLQDDFPDLPKMEICIHLWLAHEPDDDTLKFLDKVAYSCSIEGVEFVTEMGTPAQFDDQSLKDTVQDLS